MLTYIHKYTYTTSGWSGRLFVVCSRIHRVVHARTRLWAAQVRCCCSRTTVKGKRYNPWKRSDDQLCGSRPVQILSENTLRSYWLISVIFRLYTRTSCASNLFSSARDAARHPTTPVSCYQTCNPSFSRTPPRPRSPLLQLLPGPRQLVTGSLPRCWRSASCIVLHTGVRNIVPI